MLFVSQRRKTPRSHNPDEVTTVALFRANLKFFPRSDPYPRTPKRPQTAPHRGRLLPFVQGQGLCALSRLSWNLRDARAPLSDTRDVDVTTQILALSRTPPNKHTNQSCTPHATTVLRSPRPHRLTLALAATSPSAAPRRRSARGWAGSGRATRPCEGGTRGQRCRAARTCSRE